MFDIKSAFRAAAENFAGRVGVLTVAGAMLIAPTFAPDRYNPNTAKAFIDGASLGIALGTTAAVSVASSGFQAGRDADAAEEVELAKRNSPYKKMGFWGKFVVKSKYFGERFGARIKENIGPDMVGGAIGYVLGNAFASQASSVVLAQVKKQNVRIVSNVVSAKNVVNAKLVQVTSAVGVDRNLVMGFGGHFGGAPHIQMGGGGRGWTGGGLLPGRGQSIGGHAPNGGGLMPSGRQSIGGHAPNGDGLMPSGRQSIGGHAPNGDGLMPSGRQSIGGHAPNGGGLSSDGGQRHAVRTDGKQRVEGRNDGQRGDRGWAGEGNQVRSDSHTGSTWNGERQDAAFGKHHVVRTDGKQKVEGRQGKPGDQGMPQNMGKPGEQGMSKDQGNWGNQGMPKNMGKPGERREEGKPGERHEEGKPGERREEGKPGEQGMSKDQGNWGNGYEKMPKGHEVKPPENIVVEKNINNTTNINNTNINQTTQTTNVQTNVNVQTSNVQITNVQADSSVSALAPFVSSMFAQSVYLFKNATVDNNQTVVQTQEEVYHRHHKKHKRPSVRCTSGLESKVVATAAANSCTARPDYKKSVDAGLSKPATVEQWAISVAKRNRNAQRTTNLPKQEFIFG